MARRARTPPPGVFAEVFILKDFKSNDFGSADSKGVICCFFGSAHSTGVRGKLVFTDAVFGSPARAGWLRVCVLGDRVLFSQECGNANGKEVAAHSWWR